MTKYQQCFVGCSIQFYMCMLPVCCYSENVSVLMILGYYKLGAYSIINVWHIGRQSYVKKRPRFIINVMVFEIQKNGGIWNCVGIVKD